MSTPSSYVGGGGLAAGSVTASECAPQPASAETTAPSRGENVLPQTPNTARNAAMRYAISNSFGFGGQNVSLVLSEFRG